MDNTNNEAPSIAKQDKIYCKPDLTITEVIIDALELKRTDPFVASIFDEMYIDLFMSQAGPGTGGYDPITRIMLYFSENNIVDILKQPAGKTDMNGNRLDYYQRLRLFLDMASVNYKFQ